MPCDPASDQRFYVPGQNGKYATGKLKPNRVNLITTWNVRDLLVPGKLQVIQLKLAVWALQRI